MVKKGESEKKYWRDRLGRDTAWDRQRTERDHLRLEKDRNHRQSVEISREEDRQTVYAKRVGVYTFNPWYAGKQNGCLKFASSIMQNVNFRLYIFFKSIFFDGTG